MGAGRIDQRGRSERFNGEACTDNASVEAGLYGKTLEVRGDEARREGIAGPGRIDDSRRSAQPSMKVVFAGVVQNAASRPLLV